MTWESIQEQNKLFLKFRTDIRISYCVVTTWRHTFFPRLRYIYTIRMLLDTLISRNNSRLLYVVHCIVYCTLYTGISLKSRLRIKTWYLGSLVWRTAGRIYFYFCYLCLCGFWFHGKNLVIFLKTVFCVSFPSTSPNSQRFLSPYHFFIPIHDMNWILFFWQIQREFHRLFATPTTILVPITYTSYIYHIGDKRRNRLCVVFWFLCFSSLLFKVTHPHSIKSKYFSSCILSCQL